LECRAPPFAQAIIEPRKLHGYLLSMSHPTGRFKARFFAALGYHALDWQVFETDLRAQHLSADAEQSETYPDGQLYDSRHSERTERAVCAGSQCVVSFRPCIGDPPLG